MNPIMDTGLLKYHRVDYGARIDTEGVRRVTNFGRTIALVMIAVVGLNFAANFLVQLAKK